MICARSMHILKLPSLVTLLFLACHVGRAEEPATSDAAKLAAKEVELRRLQAEVAELRSKLWEPQIAVHVRMVELPQGTLERLDAETRLNAGPSSEAANSIIRTLQTPAFKLATNEPLTERLVSWLARPDTPVKSLIDSTVVTPSKRPTFLHFGGGEIPIAVPAKLGHLASEYRSGIYALPELLDDGRIKLHVRPRWNRLDPSKSVTINGADVPAVRVHEFDLTFETRPGQVAALYGFPQAENPETTEIVTLISVPWVQMTSSK
jgi:Flp pilus assembly secretin CpaC